MERQELLEQVSTVIGEMEIGGPVRVAIDGVDGAGKTTFANELVDPISRYGRPVIRVSIDSFHNPRAIRYFRGRHSAEGYFRDSFNYDALIASVLEPLGPGGSRQYRPAAFDYKTDEPVISPQFRAPENAVLLLDGVFLLRPSLMQYFELSIFLDVTFETSRQRIAIREGSLSSGPRPKSYSRYVGGQRIYLAECHPQEVADLLIDNNDIENPTLDCRGSL